MSLRIAVVGADGQLGSQIASHSGSHLIIPLTKQACDVTNRTLVQKVMEREKPNVVVNCAAFHRVEECERDPQAAYAVNTLGAHTVSVAAASVQAAVFFISTDYVFDGVDAPFLEDARPNPLNVYGASKLGGEHLTRMSNSNTCIIRTSALFGVGGSREKGPDFVERIISQARSGVSLSVVGDQRVAPTYVPELAVRIIDLIEKQARGIVHVTNAGSCSWFELAAFALKTAGIKADIHETLTEQTLAKRPLHSVLASMRLEEYGLEQLSPWQDSVSKYLRERDPSL